MQKLRTSKSKGFTIIEVLIVLAIAGLILMVVFLAVPALNRNSRNTSIKNDVQNVLGGVSEYRSANNGSNPTTITTASGVVTFGAGNTTTIKVQGTTTASSIAYAAGAPTKTTLTAGIVQVMLGAKCNDAGTAPVQSNRSVAAFYTIETSGDTVVQCVDA